VVFESGTPVPEDVIPLLEAGSIESRRLPDMTRNLIAGAYGPELGREILAIEDGAWHGPFETLQGVHYVRILGRTPEMQADFEAVKPYLQGDWMMDQSRSLIRQEVERVSADYEVLIEAAL
jgi:parvulin-like peptidyl-prolyl isomerase